MSVDLPDPDGPMMAVKRPRANSTDTSLNADDLGVALAVHLPQPDSARCGMVGVQRRRGWHSHWGSSVCRVTVRRYGARERPDSRTRPVPRPGFGDDVIETTRVPREDKCPDARWVVHSRGLALVVVHRSLCLAMARI